MQDNERQDEVIIERRGTAGIIRLNRPRALNSLTLPMIRTITAALHDFAGDPEVASVVMVGRANAASAPAAISAPCMRAPAPAMASPEPSGARNSASTT